MGSKASKYNVLADYLPSTDTEVPDDIAYVNQDPYWIIAVYSLGQPLSYNRTTRRSIGTDITAGAQTRTNKPIIITDDCLSLNISGTKSSYIKGLSANLKLSNTNYLTEVLPGDWVVAWIVNSRDKYNSLLARLNGQGKDLSCNLFDDGLKFIGRAQDIRMDIEVAPQTGTKTSSISLRAQGFYELSAQFFYDPQLSAINDQEILQWYAKVGVLDETFAAQLYEHDNINLILPAIINLVLGIGVAKTVNPGRGADGEDIAAEDNLVPGVGAGATPEAPAAYLVPKQIGALLNKAPTVKGQFLTYADIMELWMGLPKFQAGSKNSFFIPNNIKEKQGNTTFLDEKVTGTFLMLPTFANKPVWQQLQQYLNPVINEMYTALKVNKDGRITPQLTVRQIPFTTNAFVKPEKIGHLGTTKFLDLPRWQIPKVIVGKASIGRSDSTRYNYVHVYANAFMYVNHQAIAEQIARNPPIRDDLDIQRTGVRTYMAAVDCHVSSSKNDDPAGWMALIADWTIGSQYTLNGTLTCFGISSPIAEGDNIEFDSVIYHVESVQHSCFINPLDGKKAFHTTLSLTNGMLDTEDAFTAFPSYPGFKQNLGIGRPVTETVDDQGNVVQQVESERTIENGVTSDNQTEDNVAKSIRPTTTVIRNK